jgi:hypothetical protein
VTPSVTLTYAVLAGGLFAVGRGPAMAVLAAPKPAE